MCDFVVIVFVVVVVVVVMAAGRHGIGIQALVYDILPSTTAVFSYAIRSRKLSANEQFFVSVPPPSMLSGIFLQILPDLVTPLTVHSVSPRSCPPTRSEPSERFGY